MIQKFLSTSYDTRPLGAALSSHRPGLRDRRRPARYGSMIAVAVLLQSTVPFHPPAWLDEPVLEFAVTRVPCVTLDDLESKDHRDLHLPKCGLVDPTEFQLVDGWLFWVEGRHEWGVECHDLSQALWAWSCGGAIELRATHVGTGQRLSWFLPGISPGGSDEEQDAWLKARWHESDGRFTTRNARITSHGAGFWLQDSSEGTRRSVRLEPDGSVREGPDLARGVLWSEAVGVSGEFHGVSVRGTCVGVPGGGDEVLSDVEALVLEPAWRPVLRDEERITHRVDYGVHADGNRWLALLVSRTHVPLPPLTTPAGPRCAPWQTTIVEVDMRSGVPLRRAVFASSGPTRDGDGFAWLPVTWSSGQHLVALAARASFDPPLDDDVWPFHVFTPVSDVELGCTWSPSVELVPGPTTGRGMVFLGGLEPGVALYATPSDYESERHDGWLAVRASARED